MSAVLLAVFNNYDDADRVRTELVLDGFPTDRVELATACCEPGRAALEPAASAHEQFVQYFRTLFTHDDERDFAEQFADRLDDGAATVTVHPRGPIEVARANDIIRHVPVTEIAQHELNDQAMEYAAARHAHPWIRSFWFESTSTADCIYCRLFERDLP